MGGGRRLLAAVGALPPGRAVIAWWAWILAVIAALSPFAAYALIRLRLGDGPLDRQLAEHDRAERRLAGGEDR